MYDSQIICDLLLVLAMVMRDGNLGFASSMAEIVVCVVYWEMYIIVIIINTRAHGFAAETGIVKGHAKEYRGVPLLLQRNVMGCEVVRCPIATRFSWSEYVHYGRSIRWISAQDAKDVVHLPHLLDGSTGDVGVKAIGFGMGLALVWLQQAATGQAILVRYISTFQLIVPLTLLQPRLCKKQAVLRSHSSSRSWTRLARRVLFYASKNHSAETAFACS
jgi:hypothetical protein